MTKDELKVGMLVQHRDGTMSMIMPTSSIKNPVVFIAADGIWSQFISYDDNLLYEYGKYRDIVKIWGLSEYAHKVFSFTTDTRELLWEREEKKKMTIAEIEAALGYEVEIISGE